MSDSSPYLADRRLRRSPVAEEIYRDILRSLVTPQTVWLDLGCGRALIREWLPGADRMQREFSRTCRRIVGIDAVPHDVAKNPYIHEGVVGDIEHLPFPDRSFNLLTAQMVVEHVADPRGMLQECMRVMQPGSSLLFITPSCLNPLIAAARLVPYSVKRPLVSRLQGREEDDIFRTYYRLNSRTAICRAASAVGFTIERIEVRNGAPDFAHRASILKHLETLMRATLPNNLGSDIIVHLKRLQ